LYALCGDGYSRLTEPALHRHRVFLPSRLFRSLLRARTSPFRHCVPPAFRPPVNGANLGKSSLNAWGFSLTVGKSSLHAGELSLTLLKSCQTLGKSFLNAGESTLTAGKFSLNEGLLRLNVGESSLNAGKSSLNAARSGKHSPGSSSVEWRRGMRSDSVRAARYFCGLIRTDHFAGAPEAPRSSSVDPLSARP